MPTEIVLWSFTSSKGNRQASAIMLVRKKTRAQLFNLSPYSHAEQAWAGGEDVCVCGGAGTLRREEKSFASSFRITYFSKGLSAKQMQTNKQDAEEFRLLAAWMTQQTCPTELRCIPFLLLCRCCCFFLSETSHSIASASSSFRPRVHFLWSGKKHNLSSSLPHFWGCWWQYCRSYCGRIHTHLHTYYTPHHTRSQTACVFLSKEGGWRDKLEWKATKQNVV